MKPVASYNSLYHSHGSVVAALNNPLSTPPPSLLPVGALASQLNAPVSAPYRTSQDILYARTMTNALEREQSNSLARSNPNLSQLMNFRTDTNDVQIKTEPVPVKSEHLYTMMKSDDAMMPYKAADQSMMFKTEVDQSHLLKQSHDLFEPSPPKAVPVSVENASPELRENSPAAPEPSTDVIQLKPALAVSQT